MTALQVILLIPFIAVGLNIGWVGLTRFDNVFASVSIMVLGSGVASIAFVGILVLLLG